MDSINKNQPEQNRQDLQAGDAVKKIREIIDKAPNCFFCTSAATGGFSESRPMNVRKVEDDGSLWFLSAIDSQKNHDLTVNPSVRMYFQGSTHSGFLVLNGRATISKDPDKIKDLWNATIRTWFTEGVDDPRITVIQITPTDGYYWDNKHGDTVAGIKMLVGAAIGKTLDDSIEGTLTF